MREALKILDVNKSGAIEFNEFVDWWTSQPHALGGKDGSAAQQA